MTFKQVLKLPFFILLLLSSEIVTAKRYKEKNEKSIGSEEDQQDQLIDYRRTGSGNANNRNLVDEENIRHIPDNEHEGSGWEGPGDGGFPGQPGPRFPPPPPRSHEPFDNFPGEPFFPEGRGQNRGRVPERDNNPWESSYYPRLPVIPFVYAPGYYRTFADNEEARLVRSELNNFLLSLIGIRAR